MKNLADSQCQWYFYNVCFGIYALICAKEIYEISKHGVHTHLTARMLNVDSQADQSLFKSNFPILSPPYKFLWALQCPPPSQTVGALE